MVCVERGLEQEVAKPFRGATRFRFRLTVSMTIHTLAWRNVMRIAEDLEQEIGEPRREASVKLREWSLLQLRGRSSEGLPTDRFLEKA